MSSLEDHIKEWKTVFREEHIQEWKTVFREEHIQELLDAYPELQEFNPDLAKLSLEEAMPRLRQIAVHGQTYFWRQPLPFAVLKDFLLPQLLYQQQKIRIASVGCSTGAEPYSILLKQWPERNQLEIAGYDCNPEAIKTAQEGGPYYLQKRELKEHRGLRAYREGYYHVKTINHEYVKIKITKHARQRVTFEVHDITKAPLPQQHDIIFLMHVLCHYSPQGRKIIVNNVRESLASGGWLICEVGDDGARDRRAYNEFMHQLNGFTRPAVTISYWSKEPTSVKYSGKFYQTTK